MRDKVTTELQGMLAADLIEPIDASPWVSNFVIVQKRSGGMRLCIDLCGPNKAVVPDKYPLPTIETSLVYDCAPCLLSGKTGAPAPPPLQPGDWPTKPWEHLQMDICGELASVPHHQRFLVVVYDLHSKWPEVVPMGSVTASALVDFLEQLFSR